MNIQNVLTNSKNTNTPPLTVSLKRGSSVESIHSVHAVVSNTKGRILMCAGNPEYKSFIRSSLKPFQAIGYF